MRALDRPIPLLLCLGVAVAGAWAPRAGAPAPTKPPPGARAIAIRGVAILDGTGSAPLRNGAIVIRNGRIAAVGPARRIPLPRDAWVLDANGLTALPGLIEMHAHTTVQPGLLGYWLALGVTSLRDLGCSEERLPELLRWREEIAAGRRRGPRLFVSGPPIDGDRPASRVFAGARVRTEEEAVAAVARLAERGVDVIKLYRGLSPRLARAAIAEAHRRRLPVTWDYRWNFRYVLEAVLAGTDGLEHVYYSERSSRAELEQLAESIGSRRLWFTPTLVAFRPPDAAVVDDPDFRYLPDHLLAFWRGLFWPMETEQEFATMQTFVRLVRQYGGQIVAGTDAPVKYVAPGFALHRELALLRQCGLSPLEAIQAATRNAARALHRESELGTLERGKRADLILVAGDPLRDLGALRRLRWVMQEGRLHRAADLLAEARAIAAAARPAAER